MPPPVTKAYASTALAPTGSVSSATYTPTATPDIDNALRLYVATTSSPRVRLEAGNYRTQSVFGLDVSQPFTIHGSYVLPNNNTAGTLWRSTNGQISLARSGSAVRVTVFDQTWTGGFYRFATFTFTLRKGADDIVRFYTNGTLVHTFPAPFASSSNTFSDTYFDLYGSNFTNFRVYAADVPTEYMSTQVMVNGLRNVLNGRTSIAARVFTTANATLTALNAGPPSATYDTYEISFAYFVDWQADNTAIFKVDDALVCAYGSGVLVCNGLEWIRPPETTWTRVRMMISRTENQCSLYYNDVLQIPESSSSPFTLVAPLLASSVLTFGSATTSSGQAFADVQLVYTAPTTVKVFTLNDTLCCIGSDGALLMAES
jgi:hypothetical protein